MGSWDLECDKGFSNLKEALVPAPIMAASDFSKPFRCHTDESQMEVGGTLTQLSGNGTDKAISFFSKRLSPSEENYSANDRELLGVVYFLQRFRCYLEGLEFKILTDSQVQSTFSTNRHRAEERHAG